MNWFKILKYACKEIDNFNKNFFWQDNFIFSTKHHSLSWDKVCHPKCEDSLGVRKTDDTNAVLLSKHDWEILNQPDNIWLRIVKSKYLTGTRLVFSG